MRTGHRGLMISAILRRGGDFTFIADELKQVQSTHDAGWYNGKHYSSLVSLLGHIIEVHFTKLNLMVPEEREGQEGREGREGREEQALVTPLVTGTIHLKRHAERMEAAN